MMTTVEEAYASLRSCPFPFVIISAEDINILLLDPLQRRGILMPTLRMREHRDPGPIPEGETTPGLWRKLLINRTVGTHQHISDPESVFPRVPQKFTPQNACLTFGIGDDIDVVRSTSTQQPVDALWSACTDGVAASRFPSRQHNCPWSPACTGIRLRWSTKEPTKGVAGDRTISGGDAH